MAVLSLTLAARQGASSAPQTRRLETGRLTIGRGDECDWQLPDADRDVSRIHCLIERVGDGFTITDLSTNGVFLNGASEPLGRDISAPIADRDEIAIGSYRIRVGLEGLAAQATGAELGWLPTQGAAIEPFPGWPEPSGSLPDAASTGHGPFGSDTGAGVPIPTGPGDFADWPDLGESPVPHGDLPPTTGPGDTFGWPFSGPTEPRATSPLPRDFTPAVASNLTPERDDGGALSPAVPAPGSQEPAIPPTMPPGWDLLESGGSPPAAPQAKPSIWPEPAHPAPNPAGVPPSAPLTGSAAAASPSEALGAVLEGLGLNDLNLPPGNELARLRALGALFRELAGGLRDLLNARAMTKASFQVAPTMIAARDNNPFKFSVDLDQLLEALVSPRRQAYAEPLSAVAEAVADLKTHDFALIASTQQAVRAVLDDLSPAAIIQSSNDPGVLGNLLPAARKAAWWDAYEAAHRRAVEGLEADLPHGFLRQFAQAYAEEAKKS